jgi:phosphate uptake regulator
VGPNHREIRKVQFTGKSTYDLSLPKSWIEEMHLNAGDQVALIRETDNSLSILPFISGLRDSLNDVNAIVLPDDSSSTVKRKVVSMYLAGYDIIHLKLKSGLTLRSEMELEKWLGATLSELR